MGIPGPPHYSMKTCYELIITTTQQNPLTGILWCRVRIKVRKVVLDFLSLLHFLPQFVLLVEEEDDGDTSQPTVVPHALKQIQRFTQPVLKKQNKKLHTNYLSMHACLILSIVSSFSNIFGICIMYACLLSKVFSKNIFKSPAVFSQLHPILAHTHIHYTHTHTHTQTYSFFIFPNHHVETAAGNHKDYGCDI